jgi:hypothetical protein
MDGAPTTISSDSIGLTKGSVSMRNGIGKTLTLVLGLFSLAAFLGVEEGAGQTLAVGGQVSFNSDLGEDGTWGGGARAHITLPLTGLTFQVTGDFFSPEFMGLDCETESCSFNEVSLNLLFTLPVPYVFKPYFGLGMAAQFVDVEEFVEEDKDYGTNFLAGIILGGPTFSRFKPFFEIKYQSMADFDAQTVYAGGFLLVLF